MSSPVSIVWQPRPFGPGRPNAKLMSWLEHPGSLTARIRTACEGRFAVRVLGERWQRPRRDEAVLLGERGRVAWVREIFLLCGDEPWVYARTVMPLASLRGRQRRLRSLGEKPLGSVVFRRPTAVRSGLQIGRVLDPGAFDLDARLGYEETLWARRSVLEVEQRPLLVTEVFLPSLDHGRAYG